MFKGAIFDLDDTLYNYKDINDIAFKEVCKYACEQFDIDKDIFYNAFVRGRENTKKDLTYECAAMHNRMIYFQKTLEVLGMNPICHALELYDLYWNTVIEKMELNSGVIELFKYLKKNKIKIGICTDLTAHIQHRKLRKLEIEKYIDCIVTSEEAGFEKPNPIMFELCLKKLGVKPEETFYVGDCFEKDIIGASKAGIIPIWYSRGEVGRHSNVLLYENVKDLIEIKRIVKSKFTSKDLL